MTNKKKSILSIVTVLIILLLGTSIGSSDISLIDTLSIILNKTLNISLAGNIPAKDISIIWKLRLPRVLLAFLVGGCLATGGSVVQSVLKNELASPYTLGVSSGASLGAGLIIVTGITIPVVGSFTLPFVGFVFGLMTVFSVITLLGGLAFFLYGMHVMSSGLEKMSGSKLEKILKRATDNRFTALALGAGITIAIQSSSAMTVMLVGLVNSGIMKLGQTIGVIMGSNIGTTLTAWILSVAGIESDNILVNLLKPENFAPIFALVGIILVMMSKDKRKQDVGTIMLGFAVLMSGMTLMSDAMKPLADSPDFSSVLTSFYSLPLAPILGVAVGAIFTGIIQSSAASVGILQALSLTGNITFGMALPVIMGQNIGTCVTAIISSIGVNKNAKRV